MRKDNAKNYMLKLQCESKATLHVVFPSIEDMDTCLVDEEGVRGASKKTRLCDGQKRHGLED